MTFGAALRAHRSFSKNDSLLPHRFPVLLQHLLTNLGPRARFVLPGVLRGNGTICLSAQSLPQIAVYNQTRKLA